MADAHDAVSASLPPFSHVPRPRRVRRRILDLDARHSGLRFPAAFQVIAEGAGHFRQLGLLERLARRFSSLPMSSALRVRLKRLYVAALTLQSGGRGLSASLPGGEVVRVLPEHAHLSWNPDEYRAFRDVVRPGMTALDIGANVGAYSLLLGQWVGPAGAVYAFEPSPRVFDGLVRHIELNHLAGVVHPVRAAVGGTSATL